jgi:hypothetical protein
MVHDMAESIAVGGIAVGGSAMVVHHMIDSRRTCAGMMIGTAMSHSCRSESLQRNRSQQQPNDRGNGTLVHEASLVNFRKLKFRIR